MKIIEKNIADSLSNICNELVGKLDESVQKNLSNGILLSGGLDTSILAYLASKRAKPIAFTVALSNVHAPDIDYANLMANRLGLKQFVYRFNSVELHDAFRVVIKTLDSFDPMEIRNDVVIFIGLKKAKEKGVKNVMTGDGCDELFAGYDFFLGLSEEKLKLELEKIWRVMSFASVKLAKLLGIEVKLPYLDPGFKKFAMELDPALKVRSESGRMWGKWILREAFKNLLPKEIVWRPKTPIEHGSGTSTLPKFFRSAISDAEFNSKREKYLREDRVVIRDKEHLFYYEIYRSEVGIPHPTGEGKICPFCNSNVPSTSDYCRRCGGHPV